MSDLEGALMQATQVAQSLSERPDNDTLLLLYGLYKQSTQGDVRGSKPAFFDFVGTAKYDAWAELDGTARAEAMHRYIDLVNSLRN